jgi:hypothetical protein
MSQLAVWFVFFTAAAAAASTPCSLPPSGGLLVSDVTWPTELEDLLPGTEMLQDINALVARLGDHGEAPFAVIRTRVTDVAAGVTATGLAQIKSYVERGGLLVVMGGNVIRNDTLTPGEVAGSWLLNELFGWNLRSQVWSTPNQVWSMAFCVNASGTCFDVEEIPSLWPENHGWVEPISISSLPPAAHAIYISASSSYAAVAEVGAGRVVWFAADWGSNAWNQALLAALRMGSGVHADAAPRADDLVFEGLHLVPLGAMVRAQPGCIPPPLPLLSHLFPLLCFLLHMMCLLRAYKPLSFKMILKSY